MGDTAAGAVMAMDNVLALFMLPFFGTLSDRCHARMGRRMPFIVIGTAAAVMLLVSLPLVISAGSLAAFLAVLGLLLIAIGIYRSPAVALMPDVTPKPLRSKGNALINLTGAVGGLIALALIQVAVRPGVHPVSGEPVSDYRYLFWAIAAMMALCIAVLYLTINEPKLTARMPEETPDEPMQESNGQLLPEVRRSMILILLSVFFWFMGYNAVTTAFSKYALHTWGTSEGSAAFCMQLASVAAILSYWPVGIVSSRIGRKRVIQFGVLLLAACFGSAALFKGMSPVLYLLFALVGVAWASINVNSFPMVVELASGADTGKYTGYYYTFSMAAQVLTPILSGFLLENAGYGTLFPYSASMVILSMITISLVKHGDNKPEARRGLEALDVDA